MTHRKLDVLDEKGFVILQPFEGEVDPSEWQSLRYFDYKSGGDTNFAVLASATGGPGRVIHLTITVNHGRIHVQRV